VREFEPERATLRVDTDQTKLEGALELVIMLAVDKGIRPEQLPAWISVAPSVDTGTETGRLALKGFAADRATIFALRDSPGTPSGPSFAAMTGP
jgi:hypothetical protein